MKNFEKYKTVEERGRAFDEYCKAHKKCSGCDLSNSKPCTIVTCAFAWLDAKESEVK